MEVYYDGVEVLTIECDKCEYCDELITDVDKCPIGENWCDPNCYYYKENMGGEQQDMKETTEKQIWEKTQDELTPEEEIIVENDSKLYLKVYNNTVDKMFEITDEMNKFIEEHPYRSQVGIKDPKQIKVLAHFFNPACNMDWIATELFFKDDEQTVFYGCAKLFDDVGWEWGSLPSLEELKSTDLGEAVGHLRIEKDLSVHPGDSLYDVMMGIDKNGLYELGLMKREDEE